MKMAEHQIIGTPFWKDAENVESILKDAGLETECVAEHGYTSIGVKRPGDFVRAVCVLKEAGILRGKVLIPDIYLEAEKGTLFGERCPSLLRSCGAAEDRE